MSMEFLFATGIGWIVAVGIYLLLRGRSFPVVASTLLTLSVLGAASKETGSVASARTRPS